MKKVITHKDTEKIYGWDKDRGAIYILAKTGAYERQIKSPILKAGEDIVVYKNRAYVLSGSKIYEVNLE